MFALPWDPQRAKKSGALILVSVALERLAYYAVVMNLFLYLNKGQPEVINIISSCIFTYHSIFFLIKDPIVGPCWSSDGSLHHSWSVLPVFTNWRFVVRFIDWAVLDHHHRICCLHYWLLLVDCTFGQCPELHGLWLARQTKWHQFSSPFPLANPGTRVASLFGSRLRHFGLDRNGCWFPASQYSSIRRRTSSSRWRKCDWQVFQRLLLVCQRRWSDRHRFTRLRRTERAEWVLHFIFDGYDGVVRVAHLFLRRKVFLHRTKTGQLRHPQSLPDNW